MGEMEKEITKRRRRGELQKAILASVAVAGLLSVALITPNLLGGLSKLGILPSPKKRQREYLNRARERLIKNGQLKRNERGIVEITKKGEALLRKLELANFKLKKPKHWDKKWRVLIFDIPEKRRLLRDKVRNTLIAIGFYRLQDSVWVYPYDCEDLVMLLKADFQIGKDLLYVIADSIENSFSLKRQFNLDEH